MKAKTVTNKEFTTIMFIVGMSFIAMLIVAALVIPSVTTDLTISKVTVVQTYIFFGMLLVWLTSSMAVVFVGAMYGGIAFGKEDSQSLLPVNNLLLSDGTCLNHILVKQQNLSEEQIDTLRDLHERRIALFRILQSAITAADSSSMCDEINRRSHAQMKEIEFHMQTAWGFDPNESRHTWSCMIPNPQLRKVT